MKIALRQIGKKFGREWIFSKLDWQFETGTPTAITGHNGSGKSTLLHIIAAIHPPTKGEVSYAIDGKDIPADDIFRYMSMAAPYMELIEEFSLEEAIRFHFRFKSMRKPMATRDLAAQIMLDHALHKPVRDFSSGMKQRLRLGLAFHSNTPVLLLDEPTSNLDRAGFEWYMSQIEPLLKNTCIIIGSNQPEEYSFCNDQLDVNSFKKKKRFF